MRLSLSKGGMLSEYLLTEDYKLRPTICKQKSSDNFTKISLKNDKDDKSLRLLVILSPIIIASFDSGSYELEFFKKNCHRSPYPYGLYPRFFEGFSKDEYLRSPYHKEDIRLRKDGVVEFYLNYLKKDYALSLLSLFEEIFTDEITRNEMFDNFEPMRNDIVIRGRRSILSNGIQAFYLNRYVVVWALSLINMVEEKNPRAIESLRPIKKALSSLKTPRLLD